MLVPCPLPRTHSDPHRLLRRPGSFFVGRRCYESFDREIDGDGTVRPVHLLVLSVLSICRYVVSEFLLRCLVYLVCSSNSFLFGAFPRLIVVSGRCV